jgi:hypothetical protein
LFATTRLPKRIFSLLLVAFLIAGCGGDSDPVRPQPTPLPANDTPANTVARFTAAYERKEENAWRNLFTEDFAWEFSIGTDPDLALRYVGGWFKTDETTSAQNLFLGFTDGGGLYHRPAKSIDMSLSPTTPIPDATSPDPSKYHVLQTTVDMTVVVPPTSGQTEETTYLVDNNIHRISLVRGDAIPGELDADQPADSLHWYIYKWVDQTPGYGLALQSRPSSWGRVKALYR